MSDPRVSVIVPVYNDPAGLDRTLSALVAQTYDEFKVLVVDNASTDDTGSVVRRYVRESDRVTALEEREIQGSYAARNEGIRNARGEILVFLDADVTVEPDWLETAIEAMDDHGADYVGCRVEVLVERDTPIARYDRATGFPVASYLAEDHFAPTCCLLVRRAVIEAVGPFDETLVSGGDVKFGKRIHDAGYTLHYESDVVASHPARASVRSFAKKYVRVGRGIYQRRDRDEGRLRGGVRLLRRCLPPNPYAFRARFDEPLSGQEFLELYAVDTLRKYAKTAGYLLEGVRSRR